MSVAAVVGRFSMVPCMFVESERRPYWAPRDGWVPILGPKHSDAEHLEFDHEHYHIDWRFMPGAQFDAAVTHQRNMTGNASPHSNVLTSDTKYMGLTGTPALKRRLCRRDMPEFPAAPKGERYGSPNALRWQRMERAQAFVCNKLKPGNICPHRGIDLTPFIRPDGTAICPGHGLHWDIATGQLLPRHQTSATA